ncbi:MAG: hypothetical protein ACE5J3_10120 [Methanosarcinales archaeon]
MNKKAVLDTSFWINLYHLNLTPKLFDLFKVIYVTPRIYREIIKGKEFNASDIPSFESAIINQNIVYLEIKEQKVTEIKNYVDSSSGEAELLAVLLKDPELVLLIDDSDVFWFMEHKNLIYLTTANIVVSLFATNHLKYEDAKKCLQKLYGVLKRQVVEAALDTIEDIRGDK